MAIEGLGGLSVDLTGIKGGIGLVVNIVIPMVVVGLGFFFAYIVFIRPKIVFKHQIEVREKQGDRWIRGFPDRGVLIEDRITKDEVYRFHKRKWLTGLPPPPKESEIPLPNGKPSYILMHHGAGKFNYSWGKERVIADDLVQLEIVPHENINAAATELERADQRKEKQPWLKENIFKLLNPAMFAILLIITFLIFGNLGERLDRQIASNERQTITNKEAVEAWTMALKELNVCSLEREQQPPPP